MMLLRARTLAMGCSGARPVVAETMLALLNAGLTPVVPEHGSLGASGDLAPLAHCALALIGEGEVRTPDGARVPAAEALAAAGHRAADARRQGGPRAHQRHRRDARHARARRSHDLAGLLQVADVTAAMSVEALLGTDRAFAADLVALRPQPGQAAQRRQPARAARRLGDRRQPPHGDDRVQDAYSLRCTPQVNGAARDTLAHADGVAAAELASRDRQPDGPARRPRRVVRQLPRRAAGVRLRLPRDRGRRGRRDRRAAHRPAARRHALARPAAVPRPGRRRQLGADDRPVHAGGDGRREPPPGRAGQRRLAADERDAGGPRLDGLGRGAQAAHGRRQPRAGSSPSSSSARRAASTCARRCSRPRGPPPRSRPSARPGRRPRPGPLAGARARRRRAARPRARAARRGRGRRSGTWHERRRTTRPRPARHRAHLPGLAAGSGAADAHEQPRPRRRRAPRRPRRLRRHGPRGALVGGLRRDRRARCARSRRRDAARAVRQAGRRVPHARVGAARADRQLQPRAGLGDLGRVPPPRGARPDDVRADDRGLVDLHRHPGHPAGHLRVLRRDRPPPLRRLAGRHDHADRRARRDGRRAAAGRDDERRRRAVHRGRPGAHPSGGSRRATSTRRRRPRRRDRALRAPPRDARRALSIGARGQRGRGRAARCCAPASRPTSSPTRRARTTRSSATSRRHDARRGRRACARRTPTSTCAARARRWPRTARRWSASWTRGAEVFDYGNSLRAEARLGGFERAFDYPGFVPAYIRPLFCEGKGPFRWVALSGDPADIAATDRAVLEEFPDDERARRAGSATPASGSRSRACRRASAGSATASARGSGLRFNEMVRQRRAERADRDRPRPPRLRLGRLARTARPRRWPTAPTRSPTGRC